MNFLPKKTVDSVLAAFNKMIADLETVADEQDREAARQRQVVADAQAAAAAAEAEAQRASAAITKIKALVA